MAPELPTEILAYYDRGREQARLSDAGGRLELERVESILRRELPPAPARLLDVGGGPGVHAAWLARDGYEVVLVDPVPLHIEQALALSASQPERPFVTEIGDARHLPAREASQDAVLMFGLLYHLPERTDRIAALREAARVLRPGGLIAAMAISRFASLLDGTMHGWVATEPEFKAIVLDDLATGRHRSSREPDSRWFTTAYFHRPEELADELAEAGFVDVDLVAVQGPFLLLSDLDARMADPAQHAALLEAVAAVEREPSLLGATAHMIGLARLPAA